MVAFTHSDSEEPIGLQAGARGVSPCSESALDNSHDPDGPRQAPEWMALQVVGVRHDHNHVFRTDRYRNLNN